MDIIFEVLDSWFYQIINVVPSFTVNAEQFWDLRTSLVLLTRGTCRRILIFHLLTYTWTITRPLVKGDDSSCASARAPVVAARAAW